MCPEYPVEGRGSRAGGRVSSVECRVSRTEGRGAGVQERGTRDERRETKVHGFSIVAAIFLLVVLALLGTAIVYVTGLQQSGHQLDVLGARAYQAARAGIEWGAFQVLDPNNTIASANLPGCPATTSLTGLGGTLAPFTVTVTC